MVADRVLAEVLSTFSETVVGDFTTDEVLRQLAHGAVRVLGLDGAGIMVPYREELLRFAFAAGPSAPAVAEVERLQEQLRTGPCRDSHRHGEVVNVADLAVEGEWPVFQRRAVEAGLRAVAALPLVARGRRWGVLDLYRAEPRRLDGPELAAARTLAQVATSYVLVTADRDAASQAQQELAHRAMHDPLTGLPVRSVLLEQLTHALARLTRHSGLVGVLFADLDGLKHVNDTYGHDAGDRLLLTCVERMKAALRPSDIVARLGGDEFVILLEDLTSAEDATAVARRVLAELAEPYRPDGQVLQPSASLGLALTADPSVPAAALLAHADSAMYRAKRAGRGRYEVFDAAWYAQDRARATERQDTSAALRRAVSAGSFLLQYQPIIDLTDRPDGAGPTPPGGHGRVHAVEALLRWQHPAGGLVSAQDFIPVAEQAGLMREIGAWVLSAACEQLVAWDRTLGAGPARLFVNVSTDELTGADFAAHVAGVLERTGLSASRLTLEITETGMITDAPAAARSVAALHELGCELAIDDVGTGYSSLSRLVDLPASTWKIDRSFTGGLVERPAAAAVVSAVLQLGRQLHRTVVVEGVEDERSLQVLRELGCTHVQGHLLGRPQPPQQITELLSAQAR